MKKTEQKKIKNYNAVVYKAFSDLMFILCMKISPDKLIRLKDAPGDSQNNLMREDYRYTVLSFCTMPGNAAEFRMLSESY